MPNQSQTETDRENQRADTEGMAPKKPPTESTPNQKEGGDRQATKQQDPTRDASAKADEGKRSAEQPRK